MKKRRISLYLVPLSLILPALAAAQANPLFSMRGPTITIAGSPFQGKRLGHFVQQLADGTTVTQEVRGQIARDSDGRVRVEEQRGDQPDSVEVLDPISQTALRWTSASTEATRSTPLSRFPSHVTFPSQSSLAAREVNLQESEPGKVTTESLGDKTINGLVTTGKRTSTVVSNRQDST